MTPQGPFRILLVEDNADHASLIAEILEDTDEAVEVLHAADGGEALQRLRRLVEQAPERMPDLVLMDLDMPVVDGFEALETIKSRPLMRRIPVVVLTTSQARRDVAAALERHANSYVCKTSDFAAMERMLEALRGYWLDVSLRPRLSLGPPGDAAPGRAGEARAGEGWSGEGGVPRPATNRQPGGV